MKIKLLAVFLGASLVFGACNKDEEAESCLDKSTTASFTVNGTAFTNTHTPVWLNDGIYQSLGFRHDISGGGQEIVTIIFEGDTIGMYPLGSVSSQHRASYLGPASNNNILFTGPGETGTLSITDYDNENGCITGTYTFTANFVQITGEFESVRPQE